MRCYGSADVWGLVGSCHTILDRMTVDDTLRSFGTGPDVDVQLPIQLRSGEIDFSCGYVRAN